MPERDKQVDAIARTLTDAPMRPWDSKLGEKPADVTDENWDAARQQADRVYVDLIESIDFQRVLIETRKRHLTVHPNTSTLMAAADIGFTTFQDICHECMTEVLLATATNPPWSEEPESPRYLIYRHPSEDMFLATPPTDTLDAAWEDGADD